MTTTDETITEFFSDPAAPRPAPLGVGFHLNVPHDVYLQDPAERPSLNSSTAKEIVNETPLHGWMMHPRLGGDPGSFSPTAALDRGSIVHKLILGRGQDFSTVNAKDWRTKFAQDKRKAIREAGLVPVLADDMDDYRREADIYIGKLKARPSPITFDGVPTEVTAIWEEQVETPGGPKEKILCRARFDAWREDELIVDDLKTIRSANYSQVQRSCHSFGYDLSVAHYIAAVERLVEGATGRARMRLIFLEGAPAFEVLVVEFAGSMMEVGRRKRDRAVLEWAAGVSTGVWRGRPTDVVRVEAAKWAASADLEAALAMLTNPPPAF